MKNSILIILLAIVIFGGLYVLRDKLQLKNNTEVQTATTTVSTDVTDTPANTVVNNTTNGATSTVQSTDIVVTSPHSGDVLGSVVSVSGKAKGSWYFEATAPVKVVDSAGKLLGTGHIQAQGEWMTTDFVPFTGTINLTASTTLKTGSIIFTNDNPSGDPSREKSFIVPISFK